MVKRKKAVLGVGESVIGGIQLGMQAAQWAIQNANQKKQLEQTQIAENRGLTNQEMTNHSARYNNTDGMDAYYNRVSLVGRPTMKCGGSKRIKAKCGKSAKKKC